MPEWPVSRAESGVGVLGRGSKHPPPLARWPGERCKLPRRSRMKPKPPRVVMFSVFSDNLPCYGKLSALLVLGPQQL